MMKVHVENKITLAIERSKKDSNHIANTKMYGMHSVFLASEIHTDVPSQRKG